jgi:hypothetical protein
LKLQYEEQLSNIAFNFILRRYTESPQLLAASGAADGGIVGGVSGQMFLHASDAAVRVLTAAAAAAAAGA